MYPPARTSAPPTFAAALAVALGLGLTPGAPPHAASNAPESSADDAVPKAIEAGDELATALALADVLRAGRAVIAAQQSHINDPDTTDKGLDGERFVALVRERLALDGGATLLDARPASRTGRLIAALLDSMREVMDENRGVIEREGVGFKGFVPAVFARLVNERFDDKAGGEARLKITAPLELVRNRKSRPDAWERSVFEERFSAETWPTGELHSETVGNAFRVMVPEYYGEACLACHGSPAGALDVTGYPMEGGELGDLGGSISITLLR